jgi:hypothetical protein
MVSYEEEILEEDENYVDTEPEYAVKGKTMSKNKQQYHIQSS